MRTRSAIIQAAASVFEEYGFTTASINEILSRAGVTKGGLYFHFPSKEALAQGVMSAQADCLELPAGPPGLQTLVDMTLYLAHELQVNGLLRAGVRLSVEQASFGVRDTTPYQLWIDVFRQQLEGARERNELLQHVDTTQIAGLVVGSFSGIQLLSEIYTYRADLPERVCVLWRSILPGIAVPGVLPHLRIEWPRADTGKVGHTKA